MEQIHITGPRGETLERSPDGTWTRHGIPFELPLNYNSTLLDPEVEAHVLAATRVEIALMYNMTHDQITVGDQTRWSDTDLLKAFRADVPIGLLAVHSATGCSVQREWIAAHPETPAFVLWQLAHDRLDQVRSGVASHRNTDSETLDKLSRDVDSDIRRLVACHPVSDLATLRRLKKDLDPLVRHDAAIHPRMRGQYLIQERTAVRTAPRRSGSASEPGALS